MGKSGEKSIAEQYLNETYAKYMDAEARSNAINKLHSEIKDEHKRLKDLVELIGTSNRLKDSHKTGMYTMYMR